MPFLSPMFAMLAWALLALPAGGLVLRNSSQSKGQHQEKESAQARDKRLHSCLAGKRIVLIGPSTSKMDYLTLAFFAEYGRWPSEEQIFFGAGEWGPNVLNEGGISHAPMPASVTTPVHKPGCIPGGHGETYMRYTNYVLNGHEACDCYEFGTWVGPVDMYNSTENRIYINGDTMISYFQWFGDVVPPRGTFDVSSLLATPAKPPASIPCPIGQFPGQWSWAKTVKDFLLGVVKQSRPTHLVLSASFWPINPANTQMWAEIADAGVQAVMDTKGQVIWRTTPQRTDFPANAYNSPRVDMTNFVNKGWKLFPAQHIVQQFQGFQHPSSVFYDFAHLRPGSQCFLSQSFLQTHVCPGMI